MIERLLLMIFTAINEAYAGKIILYVAIDFRLMLHIHAFFNTMQDAFSHAREKEILIFSLLSPFDDGATAAKRLCSAGHGRCAARAPLLSLLYSH